MVLGHKNVENVNQINVGSAVIDRVSEIKYLGCIIDENVGMGDIYFDNRISIIIDYR